MNYIAFSANNKEYKLRLTTRSLIELEKSLKQNPLTVFGDGKTLPEVTTLITIFHAALRANHPDIKLEDSYDIFDTWLEEGNTITDFLNVIVDIYTASGLIAKDLIKN